MLKAVTSMSYTQLLQSLSTLRSQHGEPESVEPLVKENIDSEEIRWQAASEEGVPGNADVGHSMQTEGDASAETTKEVGADSDIASSRSESPMTQPATPSSVEEPMPLQGRPTITDHKIVPKEAEGEDCKKMTEEQKYQAKVLILDLLGWGVTPDYMLQRGISQELICTVFNELRLRLPTNISLDQPPTTQSQ